MKWWYWRPPGAETSEEETSIVLSSAESTISDVERLRKAAARHKNKTIERLQEENSTTSEHSDQYWKPMAFLPPNPTSKPPSAAVFEEKKEEENTAEGATSKKGDGRTVDLRTPLVMAVISAASVGFRGKEAMETQGGGVLHEHVAGSMALEVVNSFELQIALAGATWFLIGMGVHLMVDAIVNKQGFRR